MKRLIMSTVNGYAQHYCIECVEQNTGLRAYLEHNLDRLEISEQVCGGVL